MKKSLAAVVLILIALGFWWAWNRPNAGTGSPPDTGVAPSILDRIVRGRPRDLFQPIDSPEFVAAEAAAQSMSDDELVLGLEVGGDYRAYAINYLEYHDMVIDKIGDVPILVTW